LLDARYHRSDPGPDGDVLGEEQWAWLEAELTGSEAQLHVIGGGFQFLPTDHPYEKWANFGQARARLFDVINRSGAPGVILLSGDRHISEIMKVEDAALPYLLYEVTSSGMTHSWSDNPGEANRYRLGELYTELGFGTLDIDWEGGQVSLQLRDPSGAVAVEQVVRLEELRAR
jgi:alkaline phosphatase D